MEERAILRPLPRVSGAPIGPSAALRYLNLHWRDRTIRTRDATSSTSVKQRAAQRLARFVIDMLGPYLQEEMDFRAHLVRVQNEIAVAHDELTASTAELRDAMEMTSVRLLEHAQLLHRSLEDRVVRLEKLAAEE
jgi:hypothetical protein